MSEIALPSEQLPAMTSEAIGRVRALEDVTSRMEQAEITTHHVLHGGVYSRTICIPKGVALTGVLIDIPTTVTISGDVDIWLGEDSMRVTGYQVLPARGKRKQAFLAHEDTYLTMAFATQAKSIEDAEVEFTHEASLLMSRSPGAKNIINVTGE